MTPDPLAALEHRLARTESDLRATQEQVLALERRERRSLGFGRVLAGVGGACLAASLFFAGVRPGESQTTASKPGFHRVRTPFVVMDNADRVVLRVSSDPKDGGRLELFDGTGRPVISAGADGSFRGLVVHNHIGTPTGFFEAGPNSAELTLRDNAGVVVFEAP